MSVLAASWIYSHQIGNFLAEIETLKQKYSEVAQMAITIQNMANKMIFSFQEKMPQHVWFINYGDRIFPQLLSKYLRKINTHQILQLEKDALAKWVLAIGTMRDIDANENITLFLTSRPLIELIDAMVRAEWPIEGIIQAIKGSKRFTLSVEKGIEESLELRFKKLEWFCNGLLGTASLFGDLQLNSAKSVQDILIASTDQRETLGAGTTEKKTSTFSHTISLNDETSSSVTPCRTPARDNFLEFLNLFVNFETSLSPPYPEVRKCLRSYKKGDANLVSDMIAAVLLTSHESAQLTKFVLPLELTEFGNSLAIVKKGSAWLRNLKLKESTEESRKSTVQNIAELDSAKAYLSSGKVSEEVQALLYLLSRNDNYPLTDLTFKRYVGLFQALESDPQLQNLVLKEVLPLMVWESTLVVPNAENSYRSLLQHVLGYLFYGNRETPEGVSWGLRKKINRYAAVHNYVKPVGFFRKRKKTALPSVVASRPDSQAAQVAMEKSSVP
ncbi:hypothetical protein O181_002003 [Austropuccinia psidii MF-1]|uniref:Uncharacterized protein n=1 Tax=Austropuccinia psidii MF-1 TaxID=1389203 RepID=A0A9Q3BBL6_9BASI|nr:hypothetical protein [Austropuccinia psidii MF-1]